MVELHNILLEHHVLEENVALFNSIQKAHLEGLFFQFMHKPYIALIEMSMIWRTVTPRSSSTRWHPLYVV